MFLAQVIGQVVASQKDEKLTGSKLLMVREVTSDVQPVDKFIVVVDAVGAGPGEIVVIAEGSSARMTAQTQDTPTDAVIIGIVDIVQMKGETKYEKRKARA
jgi:microcompartment protein CcmK/EutM